MKHEKKHQAYYSVALPPEALWIIEENVERSTPTELVGRIQALYRNLTSAQVHRAWTEKSQVLWERRADQLPSARALLAECGDEVDVLDTVMEEGVEQLCWAYKKLAKDLKKDEFTKEIAMDATCESDSICGDQTGEIMKCLSPQIVRTRNISNSTRLSQRSTEQVFPLGIAYCPPHRL